MIYKPRIMIVEDNDDIRRVARKMFERLNCEVQDYSHGLTAYRELVEQHLQKRPGHYRLILSDINMPEMDGIVLARSIEDLIDHKKTNLVLMTGKPQEGIPGFVKEVLSKPFPWQDTIKRICDSYVTPRN